MLRFLGIGVGEIGMIVAQSEGFKTKYTEFPYQEV